MHYIQQLIHDEVFDFQFCYLENKVVDIFRKPLTNGKLLHLKSLLGIKEVVFMEALACNSFSLLLEYMLT